MKNKKSNKLPKFNDGGKFKKDLGEYVGNTGAGLLDIVATTAGMPNVADKLYTGQSANQFQNVAGGIGQVSAVATPMIANTFLPGSGTAIKAAQVGLGAVDKGVTQNNQAIDPQTGKPYTGMGDVFGKGVGSLGAGIAPMLMARNGGIIKYGNGGKSSDLTAQVKLNQDPTQIPQGINPGGYNKFQEFLASKNLVNDPRMNTNEGRKQLTDAMIAEYNSSDYIKKYPKNAITPESIKAIQSYHKLSDPNVQVDSWVGSQTSQMKYPIPNFSYTRKSNDPNSPDYNRAVEDTIKVNYGNKEYILPGNKFNGMQNFKRTDLLDPNSREAVFKFNIGGMMPEAGITSNQHVYENYKTKTNGMMVYTHGGLTPNAEVEKQENTLNPDGSTYQFDGPSHENGGIKTNLEKGTMIFSDKLKPKGSKLTFADLNKSNMTNKEDKVLNTSNNSREKLTAELMKMAKNKISESLFAQQEALKKSKLDNYAKRLGINTSPEFSLGGTMKYSNGGYSPDIDPDYLPQRNTVMNTQPLDYGQGMELKPTPTYTPEEITKVGIMSDSTSTSSSPNWGAIGTQLGLGLANNIGNIYDLKRANDVEKIGYNKVTPQKVDPTAALRYNDAQARSFNEALRNSSVGNSSTYIQNRKDAGIQQMYANDQIRQQYANTNAQIQNQANYYNAGIGDKEIETNMMNRAQSRNIKFNAYANIGQNIMGQYGDYKRGERDQDVLKMYGQMYQGNQYNPAYIEYLKKQGK